MAQSPEDLKYSEATENTKAAVKKSATKKTSQKRPATKKSAKKSTARKTASKQNSTNTSRDFSEHSTAPARADVSGLSGSIQNKGSPVYETIGTAYEKDSAGPVSDSVSNGSTNQVDEENAKKATTLDLLNITEVSPWRDEVEKRLLHLLDIDPEVGLEKVHLFAARNAMKSMPVSIHFRLTDTRDDWNGWNGIDWLAAVWRAALVGWGNNRKKVVNLATAAAGAAEAIASADVASAYKVATFSAYTADAAFSAASASSNESASYAADTAIFFTLVDGIGYVEKELEVFEASEFSFDQMRSSPLWPDKQPDWLNDYPWQQTIDNWLESLPADKQDSDEAKFIRRLKRDYSAILNGVWSEEAVEPKITSTADQHTRPDEPASYDSLGRERLVNALAPRLLEYDADRQNHQQDHLTIGLLGDWGIGKSSVIRQLKQRLTDQKKYKDIGPVDYLFGEFNAWSYEHVDNIQAGMAHEVTIALTEAPVFLPVLKKWFHKSYVIYKYSVSLHGPRIMGNLLLILGTVIVGQTMELTTTLSKGVAGLTGIGVIFFLFMEIKKVLSLPLTEKLKTYLRLPSYQKYLGMIPEMRKNIRTLCDICLGKTGSDKNHRRLLFFIDDLDRCGVEGIVKTLEAVRLVLDIPNVNVVIAMDQRVALPALACHYKAMSEFHQRDPLSIARDYLAKVIHLPIRLQKPDDQGIALYLSDLWKDEGFFQRVFSAEKENEVTGNEKAATAEQAESKSDGTETKTEGNEHPSLQDIMRDLDRIDVSSYLKKPDLEGAEPSFEQGFNEEQKLAFYQGVIKFNLRNPRQIKRLYNSYNLLWSIYDGQWKDTDWEIYLIALLVLEMINEHLRSDHDQETRDSIRRSFFTIDYAMELPNIDGVDRADIEQSRIKLLGYQQQQGVNLLKCLEPFVLPAISPHYETRKEQAVAEKEQINEIEGS
jgi:hypothetical protein